MPLFEPDGGLLASTASGPASEPLKKLPPRRARRVVIDGGDAELRRARHCSRRARVSPDSSATTLGAHRRTELAPGPSSGGACTHSTSTVRVSVLPGENRCVVPMMPNQPRGGVSAVGPLSSVWRRD